MKSFWRAIYDFLFFYREREKIPPHIREALRTPEAQRRFFAIVDRGEDGVFEANGKVYQVLSASPPERR